MLVGRGGGRGRGREGGREGGRKEGRKEGCVVGNGNTTKPRQNRAEDYNRLMELVVAKSATCKCIVQHSAVISVGYRWPDPCSPGVASTTVGE